MSNVRFVPQIGFTRAPAVCPPWAGSDISRSTDSFRSGPYDIVVQRGKTLSRLNIGKVSLTSHGLNLRLKLVRTYERNFPWRTIFSHSLQHRRAGLRIAVPSSCDPLFGMIHATAISVIRAISIVRSRSQPEWTLRKSGCAASQFVARAPAPVSRVRPCVRSVASLNLIEGER